MADQTQPALAPGQVWRSPSGDRTRTVVDVYDPDPDGGSAYVVFRNNGSPTPRHWGYGVFVEHCDGWTLDAPAETKEI